MPIPQVLNGVCVLNPREPSRAPALTRLLTALGAKVLPQPLLAFAPPKTWAPFDKGVQALKAEDWVIFTSSTAWHCSVARLANLGLGLAPLQRVHTLAVGAATAKAMKKMGMAAPLLPSAKAYHQQGVLGALQTVLAQIPSGQLKRPKVFFPRAQWVNPALEQNLQQMGLVVVSAAVYSTTAPPCALQAVLPQLQAGNIDWLACTSASVVKHFVHALPKEFAWRTHPLKHLRFASMGATTTQALNQYGLRAHALAKTPSLGNLVRAIAQQQLAG